MTVHFKQGISRHQNKHKARRVKPDDSQRAMRLAGLRSDQLGICREPQFQSKKKVPINPPQVSTSFHWEEPSVLTTRHFKHFTSQPTSSPTVLPVPQADTVENVETPLAPRACKTTKSFKTTPNQEDCLSDHISSASADRDTQKQSAEEDNHVLIKKAGLRSKNQRNALQNSEYQRQFQWKSSAPESPLLTAQEMLCSSNRSIPPFKSSPVVLESEYKRTFKGSPLPKGPRLRRDIELNEDSLKKIESFSPEKLKKKKQKHQHLSRKSSLKGKTPHSEQKPLQLKPETPQAQKAVLPKVLRKVKTEYSSNFRSPLQYCWRDGSWVRSKTVGEEGLKWYQEVQELREKAESYRKRSWGTHFSRQHLNQILSEQNCLWEVSSGSTPSTISDNDSSNIIDALDLASVRESGNPSGSVSLAPSRKNSCNKIDLSSSTLPGQRRKGWYEEKQHGNEQPEEINGKENINGHFEDNKEKGNEAEIKSHTDLPHNEESGKSSDEGRLPTPKHKTMLATQRTHHDRTTPVTGGAILASPLKMKYTKMSVRCEPPLGKTHSPYKHLSCVSMPEKRKTKGVGLSPSSPAAGLATVDPIPLRDDTWAEVNPESLCDLTPARKIAREKASSTWLTDNTPSNANRIQGELGVYRPDRMIFPSSLSDDLDDRMSQISFRSAASCSMASQVLDRAQKRKEDFWG